MAALLNTLRRIRRCESGAELVEMALAFPLLLLVVLGIMDFGLMFQRYEVLTNAAREGARVAVLPDYQASLQANVNARVQAYISTSFLGGSGTVVVEPVSQATASPGAGLPCMTTVTVTVSYPHNFQFLSGIMGYFGSSLGSRTLFARSSMRAESAAGGC